MNFDFLNELREYALYFKLETGPKDGGAIDVESLAHVLEAVNTSFKNYFDAELRNQYQKQGKITAKVDKEIRALKEEARLLVVDLKFASFEAAVSPNSATSSSMYAYLQQPVALKRKIFQAFENDVFYSDLSQTKTIQNLSKRFTREERAAIFGPLERTIFNPKKYSFKYGKSFTDLKRSFKPLTPDIKQKLIPPADKLPAQESLYKVYVVAEGDVDLFGPKPRIKRMLATEKLDRADYPFQAHKIVYQGTEIILKETITASVEFDEDENQYFITYPDLNITVWGSDRGDAEEAFKFAFHSIVQNIYNESDENLTKKAREKKLLLASLIDQIK